MEDKTKQKKNNRKKYLILFTFSLFLILSLAVNVLAYDNGQLPLGNLWDICIMVFGSFWMTVLVMIIVFGIILAIGGVSSVTIVLFEALFFEAMILGYGSVESILKNRTRS